MPHVPADADRDFVAGALVVDDDRLLLLQHRKLGIWLQPGGHVELRETPDETAQRETREETGITIAFHDAAVPDTSYDGPSRDLPQPFRVNVHEIRDGHWHCSFLYLATVADREQGHDSDEHDGVRWFARDELQDRQYDIPENIREAGIAALNAV